MENKSGTQKAAENKTRDSEKKSRENDRNHAAAEEIKGNSEKGSHSGKGNFSSGRGTRGIM